MPSPSPPHSALPNLSRAWQAYYRSSLRHFLIVVGVALLTAVYLMIPVYFDITLPWAFNHILGGAVAILCGLPLIGIRTHRAVQEGLVALGGAISSPDVTAAAHKFARVGTLRLIRCILTSLLWAGTYALSFGKQLRRAPMSVEPTWGNTDEYRLAVVIFIAVSAVLWVWESRLARDGYERLFREGGVKGIVEGIRLGMVAPFLVFIYMIGVLLYVYGWISYLRGLKKMAAYRYSAPVLTTGPDGGCESEGKIRVPPHPETPSPCSRCGESLADTEIYCPECGVKR